MLSVPETSAAFSAPAIFVLHIAHCAKAVAVVPARANESLIAIFVCSEISFTTKSAKDAKCVEVDFVSFVLFVVGILFRLRMLIRSSAAFNGEQSPFAKITL